MLGLGLSKQKRKPSYLGKLQKEQENKPSLKKVQQSYTVSNQTVEAFSFSIKKPLENDSSCYWSYNVPFLKSTEKGITLATQSFQTILTNYIGDDFPQKISFAFRNFTGYSDSQGQPTKVFLVLNLVSTSIKTQIGITSRDLIYRSQMENVWALGGLRNLQLQVYLDDSTNPLAYELTTPIQITFKLIHISI